jgi:hypothetical protein
LIARGDPHEILSGRIEARGWRTTAPTAMTQAAERHAGIDPDPAPHADRPGAAGPLPRQGLQTSRVARPRRDYDLAPHVRSRGEEIEEKVRTPGWRARRWVVEACHSWINRNRALVIRWSKNDENHLALLTLACGLTAFKKARAATAAGGPIRLRPLAAP